MSEFTVHDEASASWAVDKILAARERAARIRANCEEMIADAEKEANSTEQYLGPMVEAWAKDNLPRDKKSLKLSTGKVQFRSVPGGARVVDENAVMDWAMSALSDAFETRMRTVLNKARVYEYIEQTGDIPPGVEIVEDRETFSVKG